MKQSKRVRRYAEQHFTEVHHTTLNPEGPGVVRIHLDPPEISDGEIGASVAILNGQHIVPLNVGWSILLTELIEQINAILAGIDADARNALMDAAVLNQPVSAE